MEPGEGGARNAVEDPIACMTTEAADRGGTATLAGPGGEPGEDFGAVARRRSRETADAR